LLMGYPPLISDAGRVPGLGSDGGDCLNGVACDVMTPMMSGGHRV